LLFLRHPAWLWLKKFDKAQLPAVDDNLQAMFDAGHEFEGYAEKLFPDGVKVGFDIKNFETYKSMPSITKEVLDKGTSIIFQGRFEVDELTCIIDVLERVKGNTFDLIEIKSSTKAKPEHNYDLAFQVIVLEKSGLTIRHISVIHATKEYVRDGDIDSAKLTARTDVTEEVKSLIDLTNDQIKKALSILSSKQIPDISPRFANEVEVPRVQWFSEWLEIYKSLKPDLDPYSIYFLAYPDAKQIGELEDNKIATIGSIPEDLALRPKQVAQIQTTRDNTRIIKKDKLREFLATFEYPLYFFDYETFSSVIPAFDGCSPYSDYPFQFSLHILDAPDAKVRHEEYLHEENSNPMPALIEKLQADIGNAGTVLTWNVSYEKGCNDRMANLYPVHKDFLESLNERINDLMIPFSKMWFFDKDFFGSASIKSVLPVLVTELTYKELDISDGLLARRTWTETVLEGKHQDNRDKIMSDLSKYCTLDTFAMVKILEKLQAIVDEN